VSGNADNSSHTRATSTSETATGAGAFMMFNGTFAKAICKRVSTCHGSANPRWRDGSALPHVVADAPPRAAFAIEHQDEGSQ
jgi:hypothetical protein